MYLAIGRPEVWANEPNSPDTPTTDTQSVDFSYWRNILGMKRITTNNVSLVIARRDWASSTVYTQYDDTDASLMDKSFYVVDRVDANSYYHVYKCLWNNNGAPSTVSPAINIQGNTSPVSLSGDGYVWQYMYRIEPDKAQFITPEWVPVFANTAVASTAASVPGQLPIQVPLIVSASGSGYDTSNVASITATITGDGRDASLVLTDANFLTNGVSSLLLTSGGTGYTQVTNVAITQLGVSNTAIARVLIPPYPNHGYNPSAELGCGSMMLTTELDYDESGKLTVANDYRRIMLVVNPLLANGAPATDSYYRQTYDLTLASNTAVFLPDDTITVTNTTYAVTATVVDVVTQGSNNVVRVTSVSDFGRTGLVANSVTQDAFMAGDTITSGAKSGVIAMVSPPELQEFSGDIVYVNNHTTINRASDHVEQFKLVLQFNS